MVVNLAVVVNRVSAIAVVSLEGIKGLVSKGPVVSESLVAFHPIFMPEGKAVKASEIAITATSIVVRLAEDASSACNGDET